MESRRDFCTGVGGGQALFGLPTLGWSFFRDQPDGPHQITYAQSGEDLLVKIIFECLRIPLPVTYLDVGACYPIEINNTYLFYKAGCRGVLVEPNTDMCKLLTKVRPRDTVLNIGIGVTTQKEADYYLMNEPGWNTFSKEEAEHQEKVTNKAIFIREVIKMPLVDINTVIAEQFGKAPDYISIDAEGLHLAILKTLDFAKYRPVVICIETLVTGTARTIPETAEFMKTVGYVPRAGSWMNTLFVDSARIPA